MPLPVSHQPMEKKPFGRLLFLPFPPSTAAHQSHRREAVRTQLSHALSEVSPLVSSVVGSFQAGSPSDKDRPLLLVRHGLRALCLACRRRPRVRAIKSPCEWLGTNQFVDCPHRVADLCFSGATIAILKWC